MRLSKRRAISGKREILPSTLWENCPSFLPLCVKSVCRQLIAIVTCSVSRRGRLSRRWVVGLLRHRSGPARFTPPFDILSPLFFPNRLYLLLDIYWGLVRLWCLLHLFIFSLFPRRSDFPQGMTGVKNLGATRQVGHSLPLYLF